jgi:DNA-binding beta-propeller fold protein YncE
MKNKLGLTALIACGLAVTGGQASAQVMQLPVPGETLRSFDISWVDQASQRYFLADRSNKGIDIWDARSGSFIGNVGGMMGIVMKDGKVDNDSSGPNGVVTAGDEAWVGDGGSRIQVVNLKTMKIVDTIATGGKMRADELDYDPKNQVIIIANDADDPPFLTVVSTKPGHQIIGKITVENATDGIEQAAYNPDDGMFYVSIPEVNGVGRTGEVLVIDPASAKVTKTIPTENCHGNGLVFGPNQNYLVGCTAHGAEGLDANMQIMNARTGDAVTTVPGVGGVDEIAYSKRTNQYYGAASNGPAGHTLVVIDAAKNKFVTQVPIQGGSPHSVAVSEANGHVFVPVGAAEGGCACIKVYAGPL